jgi:hypothetical protein
MFKAKLRCKKRPLLLTESMPDDIDSEPIAEVFQSLTTYRS